MAPQAHARGLILLLFAACRSATGPGPGRPADVASIRLFDQGGYEETSHLPIYAGYTTLLVVHLYRANGQQITQVEGGVAMSLSFAPATLAKVDSVGDPLSRNITPTAPAGTGGSLSVKLQFPADTISKTFGPFDVLVH